MVQRQHLCEICQKKIPYNEIISAEFLSENIFKMISTKHPNFSQNSFICFPDLNKFRSQFIRQVIQEDIGEITQLEEEVLTSIKEEDLITNNLNNQFEEKFTFGQRVADKIALFGGSWSFILTFGLILILWIILNTFILATNSFDPYPFIFLNLVLSCLAALQAPFIMMSQNRQAEKDRLRAELDYKINLKAELEIRHLKSKIDQLASHQWIRLLEIQQLQTELMQDLNRKN